MAPLTEEPEHGAPPASGQDIDETKTLVRESTLDKLHPYVQVLNINDLESVVNLENATFPPNEACSREKVNTTAFSNNCLPRSKLTSSHGVIVDGFTACETFISIAFTYPGSRNPSYFHLPACSGR